MYRDATCSFARVVSRKPAACPKRPPWLKKFCTETQLNYPKVLRHGQDIASISALEPLHTNFEIEAIICSAISTAAMFSAGAALNCIGGIKWLTPCASVSFRTASKQALLLSSAWACRWLCRVACDSARSSCASNFTLKVASRECTLGICRIALYIGTLWLGSRRFLLW